MVIGKLQPSLLLVVVLSLSLSHTIPPFKMHMCQVDFIYTILPLLPPSSAASIDDRPNVDNIISLLVRQRQRYEDTLMVMDGKVKLFSSSGLVWAVFYLDHLNDTAVAGPGCVVVVAEASFHLSTLTLDSISMSSVNVRDCTHMALGGGGASLLLLQLLIRYICSSRGRKKTTDKLKVP